MTHTTALNIQDIELQTYLGWPDDERAEKQSVWVDLSLVFPVVPKGCDSDQLQDTWCYAELITKLREQIGEQHFHLIEHLSKFLHETLKAHYPDGTKIQVHVTKRPKILDFKGTVRFTYGDQI